jgi:hypothetical protein
MFTIDVSGANVQGSILELVEDDKVLYVYGGPNRGWHGHLDAPRYISLAILHTKYNDGRLNGSLARGQAGARRRHR